MRSGGGAWHRVIPCALLALCGCGADVSTATERPAMVPPTAISTVGRDTVQVFTNGEAATTSLIAAIRGARRSIDAEIYEFNRAEIVDGMLAAVRRGVAVRMVGDPTVDVTVATGRRLAAAGATVGFFPVAARQIDHVKLLLTDGDTAYFGGVNWGARSSRNQDYELRVRGPAVSGLARVFALDLARSGHPVPLVPGSPVGTDDPVIVTSFPSDDIGRSVVATLHAATRTIEMEMFVLTDAATLQELEVAAGRGVAVQALFDPGQDLNQAAMVRLRAAGVRCRFYRSSGERLHAKAAVIDGEVLVVGSANWTASGFRHNHELDAVLRSPVLARAVTSRMDVDWLLAA